MDAHGAGLHPDGQVESWYGTVISETMNPFS
jgi:hypothetical protein